MTEQEHVFQFSEREREMFESFDQIILEKGPAWLENCESGQPGESIRKRIMFRLLRKIFPSEMEQKSEEQNLLRWIQEHLQR